MDNVKIAKQEVTTIIFPFTISVDATDQNTQSILFDIMGKCGVLGGESTGITIDYDVIPTLNIIGIKISPTISNNANLPCDSSVSLFFFSLFVCLLNYSCSLFP